LARRPLLLGRGGLRLVLGVRLFLVAWRADHDFRAVERQKVKLEREALAVAVSPCGSDLAPEAALAVLGDSVGPMRRLRVRTDSQKKPCKIPSASALRTRAAAGCSSGRCVGLGWNRSIRPLLSKVIHMAEKHM
jgi:hypothetical protein